MRFLSVYLIAIRVGYPTGTNAMLSDNREQAALVRLW